MTSASVNPIHCREIPACAPVEAARKLRHLNSFAFLDSGKDPEHLGRYSYCVGEPFGIFRVTEGQASWNGEAIEASPFGALEQLWQRYRLPSHPDLPPFQTGLVGFLSYEAARFIESVPKMPRPERNIPDMEFGFYDVIFAHDHVENRSFILSSGWPETDPSLKAKRAILRADVFTALLASPAKPDRTNPPVDEWRFDMEQAQFEAKTADTIERILNGDMFQANLAQRFKTTLPAGFDPFAFYTHLRAISPSTFGAFLDFGRLAIASNSPERFLTLKDRQIEARPIKGTAARGKTADEDERLAKNLKELDERSRRKHDDR